MIRRAGRMALLIAVLTGLTAAGASAQSPATAEATPADKSKLWLVAGTAATTLRGDCQECEQPGAFLHTGSLFVAVGRRMNERMDAGVEAVWVPAETATGNQIRATFVLAAAQFRPWQSRGFILKTGMGMTFVRNWVYDGTGVQPPVTSKALGLTYSAGWVFRRHARVGLQVLGTQHVAALGDFQTGAGTDGPATIENVVGNFWSIGAAIVIR
jgi:hypothetical protein